VKTVRFMSFLSAVALLAAAIPAAAQAPAAPAPSPFKFEFHGWVTGSLYYQDEVFANAQGQGLTLSAPAPAFETGGAVAPKSGTLLAGDVRNSRFSFGVTGPAVLGGVPRGYIELDFFGPYSGGTFGSEQSLPRLRIAIAELKLGNTLVQVGQQNQLVIPQIPASIAHIANPMTYAAGSIGWRTPGVRVAHSMPVGTAKIELAAEVVGNNWTDAAIAMGGNCTVPATGPITTPGATLCQGGAPAQNDPRTVVSLGESGGIPMVQARIKADGKAGTVGYSAYVVGVYHQVDLNGFGGSVALPAAAGGDSKIDGYAGEVGGRLTVAGLTLAANGYVGNATGNMLGGIVQFGDIADWGAWVNLGYNITKEFSIWGLYGTNRPDEDDVRKWAGNSARLTNDLYGGMIQYAAGGYRVGVEGYQNKTTWGNGTATGDTDTEALQIIGSVGYFF
jgi:hypothetical protein